MFIYTLTDLTPNRPLDIDFLLRNLQGSLENTEDTMKKICAVDTGNDFITIEVVGTEQISVEKEVSRNKDAFHWTHQQRPYAILYRCWD